MPGLGVVVLPISDQIQQLALLLFRRPDKWLSTPPAHFGVKPREPSTKGPLKGFVHTRHQIDEFGYKHWVHEGGISSPLICRWPAGIKQTGAITHEPGHVIDLMATFLDAAGADFPATHNGHGIKPLEGKSLRPVFETGTRKGHEAIYWEHEGNRAVRQGQWKLVSRYDKPQAKHGGWQLYDLEADRTETNNLAHSNPDRAKELADLYQQWAGRADVVPWDELNQTSG